MGLFQLMQNSYKYKYSENQFTRNPKLKYCIYSYEFSYDCMKGSVIAPNNKSQSVGLRYQQLEGVYDSCTQIF